MKISVISIESGIVTVGFRKMASLIRSINPETEVCYIVPTNQMSLYSFLTGKCTSQISSKDIENIAQHLAKADMVAFSSMTPFADLTKSIIQQVRRANLKTYLIWGGIHPIVNPEDAIKYVDAICVGEGEIAFQNFLHTYKNGLDYTQTKNFWFKNNGAIIRNGFLPLQTQEDMERLPFPLYADDELIYKPGKGFAPLGPKEYRKINGIAYHTVWSIGCPYKCSFCSNSKFIENDNAYRRVRHTSVDRIIAEIKEVLRKHPYVSSVTFHDDCFIGLNARVLEDFAQKWKENINISFSIVGALPGLVKRDKLQILVKAGMYRIKMGIQTGSDDILKFYKRPATVAITNRAVNIIGEFSKLMIPPTYDIILDNPVETKQNILDTLQFVYNMPRPFTLNIFSLRVMPNTELENQLKEINLDHMTINDKSYTLVKPSIANILIYVIDIIKPPRKIFEYLLKFAKPYSEQQRKFPITLSIIKSIYMIKRGWHHIRFFEFSYFPGFIGDIGYYLWKFNILSAWHQHVLRKNNAQLNK